MLGYFSMLSCKRTVEEVRKILACHIFSAYFMVGCCLCSGVCLNLQNPPGRVPGSVLLKVSIYSGSSSMLQWRYTFSRASTQAHGQTLIVRNTHVCMPALPFGSNKFWISATLFPKCDDHLTEMLRWILPGTTLRHRALSTRGRINRYARGLISSTPCFHRVYIITVLHCT